MWPLFLARSVTLSKRMRGTIPQLREILLDVDSFVKLNPHTTKVEQDPANPQRYKITNYLPGPFHLWEYENIIHAIFTPKNGEHGQVMTVTVQSAQPLLFPKLENTYYVKDTDEPGILEVTEIVELRALFLLVPYILSTLASAHQRVLDRLADQVEGTNHSMNSN